jgi:hypothetical protein
LFVFSFERDGKGPVWSRCGYGTKKKPDPKGNTFPSKSTGNKFTLKYPKTIYSF